MACDGHVSESPGKARGAWRGLAVEARHSSRIEMSAWRGSGAQPAQPCRRSHPSRMATWSRSGNKIFTQRCLATPYPGIVGPSPFVAVCCSFLARKGRQGGGTAVAWPHACCRPPLPAWQGARSPGLGQNDVAATSLPVHFSCFVRNLERWRQRRLADRPISCSLAERLSSFRLGASRSRGVPSIRLQRPLSGRRRTRVVGRVAVPVGPRQGSPQARSLRPRRYASPLPAVARSNMQTPDPLLFFFCD